MRSSRAKIKNKNVKKIAAILQALRHGDVIAYPTEAVFGLGCDPFRKRTVLRLLNLKKRSVKKGLILIACSWRQILPFVELDKVPTKMLTKIRASWPGPVTWVFPATKLVPKWITGTHTTVAVRITRHPTARTICNLFGQPLVSTSANLADLEPARTKQELLRQFPHGIACISTGRIGKLKKPTPIFLATTGKRLRGG